ILTRLVGHDAAQRHLPFLYVEELTGQLPVTRLELVEVHSVRQGSSRGSGGGGDDRRTVAAVGQPPIVPAQGYRQKAGEGPTGLGTPSVDGKISPLSDIGIRVIEQLGQLFVFRIVTIVRVTDPRTSARVPDRKQNPSLTANKVTPH